MRMRALPSAVAVGAGRMRRCHWRRAELRTRISQLHTRAGTPAQRRGHMHGRALGLFHSGAHGLADALPLAAGSRKECRGPATAGRSSHQPCCARFSQICGTLAMAISIKSWMRATIEPSLLGVLITCYVMRNVLTSMTCKSSTCRCSLCTVAVTVLVSVCRCHSFSFSFRESTVIYNCHDTVLYD
jgi:hypothetical protein